VIEIKDKCERFDIPFFFKQWSRVNKKKSGRLFGGKIYEEMPELELMGLF